MNTTQRRPVQRAFSRRLVGLPSEPEEHPVQAEPSQSAINQAQETVNRLIDAVSVATTNTQVKKAVQVGLSPTVKRRRGRPRLYSGTTVQQRDAERKRVSRIRANEKLAALLRHFELELDANIPPGLKAKYGIEVDSYRELLASDRVQTKVVKEVIRDLKMIGKIPSPSPVNKKTGLPLMSAGIRSNNNGNTR
jgi:hypothetical protein